MKRKIFSVLFALVLLLSFSLVTTTPASATAPTIRNVIPFSLATDVSGVAAWTSAQYHSGSSSANLTAPTAADYARVKLIVNTAFSSFAAPSFYYRIGADAVATTEDIGATWPIYERSGATVTQGYLSPYPVIYITNGTTNHFIMGQPWAESTKVGWTLWNNAAASNVTTQALWHMEDFSVNPAIGGGVPAGWGPLSYWTGTAYTAYTVVGFGVGLGYFAVTGQQQAYVDDVTAGGTTYNLEGTSTDYGTIQAAINAASSGDIISVAAGTYSEGTIGVHTVANLTIESVSGAAATIIRGPVGTNKLFEIGGATNDTADGFVLDGFTLSGTYEYGVYMYVRHFDIKNNIIYHPNSDGIVVTNPTTGPPTAITSGNITNNTITGLGATSMEYRPGILLESNDAVGAAISGIIISNNTVSGFGTTTFGEEAAGIRCASVVGSGVVHDITVTGNTLTGNRIGLHIYGSCTGLDIYGNTMSANKDGVVVCNSATADIASTFNMYKNTITGNTRYGVYFLKTAAESITGAKNIMYNTISGNTIAGMLSDFTAGTDPVATYNWWGTAAGPYNATTNPGVIAKLGNAVSAHVTYAPWLYLTTVGNGGNTVANIYTNQVPAYAKSIILGSGWNTFSVPIALDGQYNSWGELYTLTSLPCTIAYRFDPATQTFVTLATDSTYVLAPGEGIYVKLTAANSIPYCYSTDMSVPSRALGAGWNLIGGGVTERTEIVSCVSIATAGGTAGYSQIISPAMNTASWVYTAGAASAGSFVAGEGYWVFLPIDRTLGLFDLTPVTWVAIP